jgi:CRP-like cAMP-binding protein
VSTQHLSQHLSRTTEPERVARALRDVPLFATVPEPYFGEIAARIRLRHFANGEAIFHQHDVGEGLYLVARGVVRIFLRSEDGQELTIARFEPGEFFGELAAIDEEPRSATAVASDATDLLVLHRSDFLSYLRARPEAAVFCLRILARRLRQADAQLPDPASPSREDTRRPRTELRTGDAGRLSARHAPADPERARLDGRRLTPHRQPAAPTLPPAWLDQH